MAYQKNMSDEVARNRIWEETIRKELAIHSLSTTFHVNPRNLYVVTEKPNENMTLEELKKAVEDGKASNEVAQAYEKVLAQAHQTPTQKYSEPLTTSQEIGWFSEPLVQRNDMFYKPLSKSDVTKYSESLQRSNQAAAQASKQ